MLILGGIVLSIGDAGDFLTVSMGDGLAHDSFMSEPRTDQEVHGI